MPIKILFTPNGSIAVGGDLSELKLTDSTGQRIDIGAEKTLFLCRCGASKTKPWCDGSHETIGFSADQPAAPLEG
jgi:CDGSH-type Zn-finger protein